MNKMRALWKRLCAALVRRPLDDNFDEELQTHVALDTERGLRDGLTHEEARRQALIRLGGAEQVRNAYRERQGLPWLESLLSDLRYSVCSLSRHSAVTTVAVLSIGLGMGANTTIFLMVSRVCAAACAGCRSRDFAVAAHRAGRRTMLQSISLAYGCRSSRAISVIFGCGHQGMTLTVVAVALGWPAAWMLAKLASSFLYGIPMHDALTFATVPVGLACVALIACWLPARRAASINPIDALRTE